MLFISKIYAGSVGLDTGPDKLAPATAMPLIGVLTEDLHPDATIAFLTDERRGCAPAHVQMWERRATTCTMPDVHGRMLGALDPSRRSLTIRTHILGEIRDAGH